MDIVTFGSATWDTFLGISRENLIKDKRFNSGEGLCFNLGSKIDLKDAYFGFGGGGVNTAFTFKKQGFDVAYCGSVGNDVPGKEIIDELKRTGIETAFIQRNSKPTNLSVIMNSSEEERTVLAYRGASELLDKKSINWNRLNASWFYLAPLSGKLKDITEDIVDLAGENKIKVAVNLGNSQIALGEKKLAKIFSKIDVLLLNEEEASLLTGIEYRHNLQIMKELEAVHQGINVITRGDEGALISDRGILYDVSSLKVKVVDAIGAGDAFGAGFVSGLIKSNMDIEWSARLGMANAISAIKIRGATTGLLEGSDDFMGIGRKLKIRKIGVEKK
jgi:ribokinase